MTKHNALIFNTMQVLHTSCLFSLHSRSIEFQCSPWAKKLQKIIWHVLFGDYMPTLITYYIPSLITYYSTCICFYLWEHVITHLISLKVCFSSSFGLQVVLKRIFWWLKHVYHVMATINASWLQNLAGWISDTWSLFGSFFY